MRHAVVAVDPGKLVSGWAIFLDRELASCGVFRRASQNEMLAEIGPELHDAARVMGTEVATLVVEVPQVYGSTARWKGDPNDLIDITLVAGAVAGVFASAPRLPALEELIIARPREWKGQRPKNVTRAATLSKLSSAELNVTRALVGRDAHNGWDAVALGMARLGRIHAASRVSIVRSRTVAD